MVCPSPLFGFSVHAGDWNSAFHFGHCVLVGFKSSDFFFFFLVICNFVPPFLAPSVPAATESGHASCSPWERSCSLAVPFGAEVGLNGSIWVPGTASVIH